MSATIRIGGDQESGGASVLASRVVESVVSSGAARQEPRPTEPRFMESGLGPKAMHGDLEPGRARLLPSRSPSALDTARPQPRLTNPRLVASGGPGRTWLAPALGTLLLLSHALAGGVVTNSSLANLYTAALGGGRVTFTSSSDLAFSFVAPLEISTDTVFDASTTTRTVSLSGGNNVRLFTVRSNATLTLINLTLTAGQNTNGGAIYNDGGSVFATNCVFRSNGAVGPAGAAGATGAEDFSIGGWGGNGGDGTPGFGGAIYNLGRCELRRCLFEGNRATGGDGGAGGNGGKGGWRGGRGGDGGYAGQARGGAIFNNGSLLTSDCSFSANTVSAGDGGQSGASGAGAGDITFTLPGYARAGADAMGGAVFTAGTATLLGCTFNTNTVAAGSAADESTDGTGWGRPGRTGGSIYGGAIANEGSLAVTNCTFVANAGTAGNGSDGGDSGEFRAGRGGDGGSAYGGALWSRGDAHLVNVTLVGGTVTAGTGGTAGTDGWERDPFDIWDGRPGLTAGGNVSHTGGSLTLQNCIVANAVVGGNGYGHLSDAGNNLSSDDSCDFTGAGSRNNTDPRLGVLGNYGGPTLTVPLLADSPAINAGAAIPGLTTDQRGTARPQGTAFDIGAVERPFAGLRGVISRNDGTPVPGILVTLISVTAAPSSTTTDANGQYQFEPQPGTDLGVYRLQPGTGLGFTPAYRDVTLTSATQSISNLDFTAETERAIGYGLDADGHFYFHYFGQPSTRYSVEAVEPAGAWQPIGEATTDAIGYFDFTDSTAALGIRFYRAVRP